MSLLNRLTRHPPGGELAFAYTTYAIWALTHTPAMSAIAGGVVNPVATILANLNAGQLG